MTTCTPAQTTSNANQENLLKPRYTVNSSKDAYEIRVELPGVKKEGVEIKLDQGILTLKGRRQSPSNDSLRPLHRELNRFDYGLRLKVTAQVDEGALAAKLEDGILTLTLPVKEAAKPRVIAVQ
jgi:HSP20 family protein